MATQKTVKTKASTSKSKPSKAAKVKKPVSRSKPLKAKSTPVKSKSAPKGKKSAPVTKAKKAVKASPKKAVKAPAAKKTALVPKAKTAKGKATAKPKTKMIAAKPKAAVKPKSASKPKAASNGAQKSVKKPAASKTPARQTNPVIAGKASGSKITDKAAKPVSSKPAASKSKAPVFKPKPITHTGKSFGKMSDKKETRPVTIHLAPEEPLKTRYNDKELEEFDQLIDQKLITAREQLEFYLKQLEDMAENPDNKIKGLDDGLSSLESERISSMAARQQKLIQHLENAKIRIKNKVYGICRETGKLISKERLRAVPHATLSIEAKQAQN